MTKGFALWLIVSIIVVGSAIFYSTSNKEPASPPQIEQVEKSEKDVSAASNASKTSKKDFTQILTKYHDEDIINVRQISKEMVGKTVVIAAKVSNVNLNKSSNTAFFDVKDINDNTQIKGVIFNKTVNDNPERLEVLQSAVNSGRHVYIKGEIDIYKGSLEIKAWKVFTGDESN